MGILTPIMAPSRRYVTATSIIVIVICLHYIFSIASEDYSRLSSLSRFTAHSNASAHSPYSPEDPSLASPADALALGALHNPNSGDNTSVIKDTRANATFVLLARNSDVQGVVESMQSMEDRFNREYGYPWVLLNEEPFTQEFKDRVSLLTRAPIHFGLIPKEHWYQPDWIDEERASQGRAKMMAQRIIYAGSVPYRNMCRFNSGFFFHHELLQPYRYYWRVEPDVKFFCDLSYDPFKYMQEHDKVYSFTISLTEWEPTIPTLWATVKEFVAMYPQYVEKQNAMDYLSNDGGETYNLCHFWSNFEIADMDFWRGEAYQKFFDFLESKGGFYYERWGDAPVHSIAVALFARRDQIHFYRDIGYRHPPFQHCPQGDQWKEGRCSCNPNDSFDYTPASCVRKFEQLFS